MGAKFSDRGWGDRTVKVRRMDLLAALKENREKHVKDYEEACEGYRNMAMTRMENAKEEWNKVVAELKAGHLPNLRVSVSVDAPDTYERAYNQIIRMMEMSVEDVVELTSTQFACFVMDDWDWKGQYEATSTAYKAFR